MSGIETVARDVARLAGLLERLFDMALPVTMTRTRAARELGVSVKTVERMIRDGSLHLTKERIGSKRMVPLSEVLRLAAVAGREPPKKVAAYNARAEAQAGREMLRRAR